MELYLSLHVMRHFSPGYGFLLTGEVALEDVLRTVGESEALSVREMMPCADAGCVDDQGETPANITAGALVAPAENQ